MVEGERTEKIERKQIAGQGASEGLRDEALKLMKDNERGQQNTADSTQNLTNKGTLPDLKLFDGKSGDSQNSQFGGKGEKDTQTRNGAAAGDKTEAANSQSAPKDVPANNNVGRNDSPRNDVPENVANPRQDPRGNNGADNAAAPKEDPTGKSEGVRGKVTEEGIRMVPRAGEAEANTRRK